MIKIINFNPMFNFKNVFTMKKILIVFLTLILTVGSLSAQKADPKADKVIEKFIQAVGGREKLAQVQEIYQKLSMKMNGMEIQMESLQSKKGRGFAKMNMMGMEMVAYAYKDGKGYTMNQDMTYSELDKEKLDEIASKNQSFFQGLDNYKQYDRKYLGKEELDGKTYEAVEMKMGDQPTVFYFDPKTHLLVAEKVHSDKTDADIITYFKDYKEYNGILFPTKMEAHVNGNVTQSIEVVEIKINPTDIDESVFQMPE